MKGHGPGVTFALLFENAPCPLSGGQEGGIIGDNGAARMPLVCGAENPPRMGGMEATGSVHGA